MHVTVVYHILHYQLYVYVFVLFLHGRKLNIQDFDRSYAYSLFYFNVKCTGYFDVSVGEIWLTELENRFGTYMQCIVKELMLNHWFYFNGR